MKKYILLAFASLGSLAISAQEYTDYIGAGHSEGITVMSSDVAHDAMKTLDGSGLDSRLFETGRFLNHATMGVDLDYINLVKDMDYETWVDAQLDMSPTYIQPQLLPNWEFLRDAIADVGLEEVPTEFSPNMTDFMYAWWQNAITSPDKLKQKVAYAYSQIFVVSSNSDIGGWGYAMADWYDMFLDNSTGNFRDLLRTIALHPNMAYYLSHLNNPKENIEENVHPDENFAREIMQLFSIGLYELNNDGTHQLDENGNSIPTYDNSHIKELAQVFTGFGAGAVEPRIDFWTTTPYFGMSYYSTRKDTSLIMYPAWHDQSDKTILKNDVIVFPQGLEGEELFDACMNDLEETIDILFNHHNVGPFISYRLIQRMVKSNPTPAYIDRVASIFNDNGNGVRGDMKAVVKAILLDPEAREGSYMFEQHSSRLKETLMRHTQFTAAMNVITDDQNHYWNGFDYNDNLKQQVLNSPTVFNFYLPAHQPVGNISNLGMVAPEFKIHDTGTAINYFNHVRYWSESWGHVVSSNEGYYDPNANNGDGQYLNYIQQPTIDFDSYYDLVGEYYTNNNGNLRMTDDVEAIINHLDKVLTNGQMTEGLRESLRENLPIIDWQWEGDPTGIANARVRAAIYLITISPDYAVIR